MLDTAPLRQAHRPSGRLPLRLAPLLALSLVALQLLAVGTLVLGRDTLYLRDVLATHLPMKQAEAAALRQGTLPELDLQRGGGQPLLGNPNGAPFYPDNLLYLVAPPIWALNAHFWLHFLLAPWSFAWLARRLGRGRAAAVAGGAIYATSGWFLSQMSFYDLVTGAALAPALVAACLAARDGTDPTEGARGRNWPAAAAGGLWALLLLGGDPAVAAIAFGAAVMALALVPASRAARPRLPWLLSLALAFVLGTAVALPQIVELLRALPTSTRGVRGYDAVASTLGSWDPRQLLEQLLPLAFGRVDRVGSGGFWGYRFHTGVLPLFLSLYPGLLPLGLAAAAGRARGRGSAFAWCVVGLGTLAALGRFNPVLAWLAAMPGGGLVRFPVKAWLLVALGLAVLAAAGWERALDPVDAAAARRLRRTLLVLVGVLAAVAVVCFAAGEPLQAWMSRQLPRGAPPLLVAGEARRWALTAAALAALGAVLALVLRRRRSLAGDAAAAPGSEGRLALALTLHTAAQLLLLAPATMARDQVRPYLRAPSFASSLRAGEPLAHGSLGRLFGPVRRRPAPGGEGRWLARQGAAAGLPLVGVPLGWRYELAASPEGLDAFLTRLGIDAVKPLDDGRRVRLLRAWGVESLLLERPLAAATRGAHLVATGTGPLAPVFLYRIEGAVPEVRRVGTARAASDPRAAISTLLDPRFDARREVVLAAGGAPASGDGGRVRVLRHGVEELELASAGAAAGWLVVQRAWQPHWRAAVDGRPARVVPADLHRLAVAVPPGSHSVRLWVDRQPLQRAAWGALAGALGLLALALHRPARRGLTPS